MTQPRGPAGQLRAADRSPDGAGQTCWWVAAYKYSSYFRRWLLYLRICLLAAISLFVGSRYLPLLIGGAGTEAEQAFCMCRPN